MADVQNRPVRAPAPQPRGPPGPSRPPLVVDREKVKEVAPAARRRDAKLSFAFVYPDRRGRNVIRQVGMTHAYGNARRLDDGKALAELSFQTGDFLDVAILT